MRRAPRVNHPYDYRLIVVHVEHLLTEAGVRAFAWIAKAAKVIAPFDGFSTIRQLHLVETPEACQLLLGFESLPQLRRWSKSQEHDEMIGELAAYRLQKQRSQVFEAGVHYE